MICLKVPWKKSKQQPQKTRYFSSKIFHLAQCVSRGIESMCLHKRHVLIAKEMGIGQRAPTLKATNSTGKEPKLHAQVCIHRHTSFLWNSLFILEANRNWSEQAVWSARSNCLITAPSKGKQRRWRSCDLYQNQWRTSRMLCLLRNSLDKISSLFTE